MCSQLLADHFGQELAHIAVGGASRTQVQVTPEWGVRSSVLRARGTWPHGRLWHVPVVLGRRGRCLPLGSVSTYLEPCHEPVPLHMRIKQRRARTG